MVNLVGRTVQSELAKLLRKEIVRGDYKPGEPLRLNNIAAQYEVSTMPVREALRTLESEGIVEVFPHRGAIVTELSPDELEDIYDIRATLEEKATRAAVPLLTEETLAKLTSLVEQMDEKIGRISAEVVLNHEFHITLYTASGRKHLCEINQSLRYRAQHYLRAFIDTLGGMPHAQDEHREILAACKKGDAEKAATLVHDHVAQVGQAIVEYLRNQQETNSSE